MLPRAIIVFTVVCLTGMLFPPPQAVMARGGFGAGFGGGFGGSFHGASMGAFHGPMGLSRQAWAPSMVHPKWAVVPTGIGTG